MFAVRLMSVMTMFNTQCLLKSLLRWFPRIRYTRIHTYVRVHEMYKHSTYIHTQYVHTRAKRHYGKIQHVNEIIFPVY